MWLKDCKAEVAVGENIACRMNVEPMDVGVLKCWNCDPKPESKAVRSKLSVAGEEPPGDKAFRRLSAPTSGSLRRRARERQRAEQTRAEGERIARECREQRAKDELEHQRKAREELASYEPWGRAGGGAPNPRGNRFTNLRDRGIFPEDELRGVSIHEACRRWVATQRCSRRRRTPMRLREDPQLCYTENLRQSVDNDIRYRQTPNEQHHYKEILDNMVDKKKKSKRDEIKRNLDYERKMHTMDSPWGKPGPGGTVWRNPRDIGLNFSKSMGWTDNEMFTKLKGDQQQNKISSLSLPKVKGDDHAKGTSADKENLKPSCVDKLPDIKNVSPKKSQLEVKKVDVKNKVNGSFSTDTTTTNGRVKRSPKKNKFIKRLSNGDKISRVILPEKEVNSDIDNENKNTMEKKLTPETVILQMTGGVELVPLLARRRRVGARTLPSSDVTRPPDQFCQWRELLKVDYLRDLNQQMRVKCIQKEQNRLDSAESVRRHHATWDSLWGKQGHGAPLRGKYARNNLARLLYLAPLTNA